AAVAGDFDNDGRLDLLIFNDASGNITSFLKGNGDGTFQAPLARNQIVQAPRAADVNGDSKLDALWVTTNALNVNLGNGAGDFAAATPYAFTGVPNDFAIGDFNGDGKPDVAVATNTGIRVLLNNGSGGFGAASSVSNGTVFRIRAGDINGDGK